MKKYFLIATLACMGLPLLFSCSNPSGTPKKDAELLKGLAENTIETRIKQMEQLLEFAQYYADQGDYKGYEKFKKKLDKLENAVEKDFKRENKAERKDAQKRIEKAEKKMRKDRDREEDEE